MRSKDRPFVLYVGGMLGWHLVPRGMRGWTQLVIWLALLAPLVMWLSTHLAAGQSQGDNIAAVMLFAFGVAAWLVGGLWWMLSHAEIVEMVEVRRKKQYARWERERRHRRAQKAARQD
jgi:hypothetical protein